MVHKNFLLLKFGIIMGWMLIFACLTIDVQGQTSDTETPHAIVAYVSRKARAADSEIFVRDLTANITWLVSNNGVDDYAPAWSPDGQKLLYICGKAICILDWASQQTSTFEFAEAENFRYFTLSWSPDGGRLLFSPMWRHYVRCPEPSPAIPMRHGRPMEHTLLLPRIGMVTPRFTLLMPMDSSHATSQIAQ